MKNSILEIGSFSIKWYSILILCGIIIGIIILEKQAKKFKLNKEYLYNLIFGILICGIVGARIYYVMFNLNYYFNNFIDIFKIWEGGLAIHGGIIGGLIFILYYTKKYKLTTLHIIDMIIPSLIIGQIIGRWGNFFNGEAHGPITTLNFLESIHLPDFIINGMYINRVYYQPTFLYESIWNLIGFIIIIFILNKSKKIKIGDITSFYLIWYSFARFFIESLRTDSLMLGNLKVAQIISIIMFIIGITIIVKNRINKKNICYNDVSYEKFEYVGDKNV